MVAQHRESSDHSPETHAPSQRPADRILRGCIYTGIFLLPFIPLIVANHFFFPFITGKNFTFRVIVEVIGCLWVILALRDGSALPKSSRLLQAFAVFIGVIFIADLLSPNIYKSFWSNYERMEGFVTLAHLFALFVVASSVMSKKLWEWFFRLSLGVSLILFIYGLMQLAGKFDIHQGATRIDTTIGNSAYLGGYMLFHVFLALYLLAVCFKKNRGGFSSAGFWEAAFYCFAILADIFILFETGTRGAQIGLVAGLTCLSAGLALFEKDSKFLKRAGSALLILIICVGTLFVVGRNSDFVKNHESLRRLGAFANDLLTFDRTAICNGEFKSRCLLWPMAFEGVKERPLLGWGQESFNYVFNKYYDPRMYSQEQWFDRTHNVFFDWLIAGGVFGLFSYLSLFGFALHTVWRRSDIFTMSEKVLFFALFVAYFLHNTTVFDNLTSYLLFFMVLAYIASVSGEVSPRVAQSVRALDSGLRDRVLIPLVSVAAVFVIYTVNIPGMLASTELIQALSGQPGGPKTNLAHFEKALSYGSFGDSEIHEQLVQTTTRAAETPGVDPKIKEDFFNLTKKEMLRQLERTPEDARYFLFAGSFLASFGDNDNAIKYLQKAHELSPSKQTILFSLGSAYLGKQDYKTAIETMKRAFELDTSFAEARRIYALALVYGKQLDVAAEVWKTLPPESIWQDRRFLIAFFAAGYFDEALRGVNGLLEKEPTNIAYYFTRAQIEVALGQRTAAIADLNKAAEINPAIKTQVADFIAQVRAGKNI